MYEVGVDTASHAARVQLKLKSERVVDDNVEREIESNLGRPVRSRQRNLTVVAPARMQPVLLPVGLRKLAKRCECMRSACALACVSLGAVSATICKAVTPMFVVIIVRLL